MFWLIKCEMKRWYKKKRTHTVRVPTKYINKAAKKKKKKIGSQNPTSLLFFPKLEPDQHCFCCRTTAITLPNCTTVWWIRVTTILRKKNAIIVFQWHTEEWRCHYKVNSKKTHFKKMSGNKCTLAPRLTKQHHLINDFVIQNICAKKCSDTIQRQGLSWSKG